MNGLIILAGGKSSRMGRNKALLPIGDKTGIERILETLAPISSDPIVVTNEPRLYQHLPARAIPDNDPGKGPLAGLEAGLAASRYEWNLLVACDMPFVSLPLAETLFSKKDGYDCVAPMIQGKTHPLFAAYSQNMLELARKNLKENNLKMSSLFEQSRVRFVKEEELTHVKELDSALFNMNHPSDYEAAVAKWRKR